MEQHMKHRIFLVILTAIICVGCGETSRLVVTDVIQIRQVLHDDPLAASFEDRTGAIVRCGDAALTDGLISFTYFKKGADTTKFDLWVVLNERGSSTWKTFARKSGRTAALLLDGKVLTTFAATPSVDKQAMKIIIPAVATSQEEADALQIRLDKKGGRK
jgi:hypothetical protein